MSKTWLLLDGNYLARRALYAMRDMDNGVLFGVMRDLVTFRQKHNSTHIAVAFDEGASLRKKTYTPYKHKPPLGEEGKLKEADYYRQLHLLRGEVLPRAGFNNVFWQDGYEGDDVIASVCKRSLNGDQAVIITSDKDFWQLLEEGVTWWNPTTQQAVNRLSLEANLKIVPYDWVMVKAIAGCSSDKVKGVEGAGELTALKYVRRELRSKLRVYDRIKRSAAIIERNRKLVELPFPGVNTFKLVPNTVTRASWDMAVSEYGLPSLVGQWS